MYASQIHNGTTPTQYHIDLQSHAITLSTLTFATLNQWTKVENAFGYRRDLKPTQWKQIGPISGLIQISNLVIANEVVCAILNLMLVINYNLVVKVAMTTEHVLNEIQLNFRLCK